MSEGKLWKLVDEMLTPLGFQLHRVESGRSAPGIPDVHFLDRTVRAPGWIELKFPERNERGSAPLRPAQVNWLHDYAKDGGNAWVLLELEDLGLNDDPGIYLWHAREARRLIVPDSFRLLKRQAAFHIPPGYRRSRDDWRELSWRINGTRT